MSELKEFDLLVEQFKNKCKISRLNRLRFDTSRHTSLVNDGHNKGCGCSLCIAKYEYVTSKIVLHRTKRKYDILGDVLSESPEDIERNINEKQQIVDVLKTKYHSLNEEIKKLQS